MPVTIRPETVEDYPAIGAVHVAAFGNRVSEALIVVLHRQRTAFDPALSLVATVDGRIAGHALFSPHVMRLLGVSVPAVNLAPIGVDPAYQGRGIGGRLIAEGHAIAAARGYTISFLLGHAGYYPRFGYRTGVFGSSEVTVPVATLADELNASLDERVPAAGDIPALRDMWLHAEGEVDFALEPGPDVLDWLSPNPAIGARVYMRDGAVVGYARVHTSAPAKPRVLLARDPAIARAIVHRLALRAAGARDLVLPLHPSSAATMAFGQPRCGAWPSAMACSLAPGPLDDYIAQLQEDRRPPGRPLWPVAFDLE